MQVNQDGRDQRIDKAKDEERREKLRLENLAKGVSRYHQKARPRGVRLALIRTVEMFINCHCLSSRSLGVSVLHRFQEDVFQRIALEIQPPDLHLVLAREPVEIAYFDRFLQDQFDPALARRAYSQPRPPIASTNLAVAAARLKLDKFTVRFSFFFQIAVRGDIAIL